MNFYVCYANMVTFFQEHNMWKGFSIIETKGNKCEGLKVVFTGIRSAEMEDVIRQNGGKVLSSFTKECTDVRFLYDGKNVIRFVGNKPNKDDECYKYVQENGGFKDINAYVYLGTDDLNLSGLSYDYRYGSIEANYRGSEYYHYASFSTMVDDGNIETKKLEDLEECILLGIDAYDDARKKYVDRLGKILSLRK